MRGEDDLASHDLFVYPDGDLGAFDRRGGEADLGSRDLFEDPDPDESGVEVVDANLEGDVDLGTGILREDFLVTLFLRRGEEDLGSYDLFLATGDFCDSGVDLVEACLDLRESMSSFSNSTQTILRWLDSLLSGQKPRHEGSWS